MAKREQEFTRVSYSQLNGRQQENYNFQKLSARLADFGFNCLRISDDWQGADLIAYHIDGQRFLKIQLKSRLTIHKKYEGKDIWIAFFEGENCFVFPHDFFLQHLVERGSMDVNKEGWKIKGSRSWPVTPLWALCWLEPYRI